MSLKNPEYSFEEFDPTKMAQCLPGWEYFPTPKRVFSRSTQALLDYYYALRENLLWAENPLLQKLVVKMNSLVHNQLDHTKMVTVVEWKFNQPEENGRLAHIDVTPDTGSIFTWWGHTHGMPIVDYTVKGIRKVVYNEIDTLFKGPQVKYRISTQGRYHFLQHKGHSGVEIHLF